MTLGAERAAGEIAVELLVPHEEENILDGPVGPSLYPLLDEIIPVSFLDQ